jgi:hypothetical protein
MSQLREIAGDLKEYKLYQEVIAKEMKSPQSRIKKAQAAKTKPIAGRTKLRPQPIS